MYCFKKLSLLIFIMALAIPAFAQETKHQHTEHLSEVLKHYLAAKEALTKDDFETARSHITVLKEEVLGNDEMNNHEEHTGMHDKHHNAMTEAVTEAEEAGNIDELRLAFKDISEYLAEALENQEYDKETLYLQYCPMANGGKGASWVSNQESIKTPSWDNACRVAEKQKRKSKRIISH